MYQRSRSINSDKSDPRSCDEDGTVGSQRRSWKGSLQLLSCVVPNDEKTWDDLPRLAVRANSDNRLLFTRSTSSSSSQQERRQSASPLSTGADFHESRHRSSPSHFGLYINEFMTPPSQISRHREMLSPYRKNTAHGSKTTAVTPEQHIDFIRSVFETDSSLDISNYTKHQREYEQRILAPGPKSTSRILLPVLDESPADESEGHEISLVMRRDASNLHGFNSNVDSDVIFSDVARDNHSQNSSTRNMPSSASGVLYEPGCSVKALARSETLDTKSTDERKLLLEAKQEIASVKEFLRFHSIANEKRGHSSREEVLGAGIETLLVNDGHIAVIEGSVLNTNNHPASNKGFPRRTSFGEKPPRPPHSPLERVSTSLNESMSEI